MRHLEVMPYNQTYNYKRTGFYGQFFFFTSLQEEQTLIEQLKEMTGTALAVSVFLFFREFSNQITIFAIAEILGHMYFSNRKTESKEDSMVFKKEEKR